MEHMDSPDLAILLPKAQCGDQGAQMAIVTAFRPLLRKLASQERDYTLRMDLSSQLVLGTLEAIRKFPGTDNRRFPGFLKKHLTFLLSHYKRKQQRWNRLKEKIYALESHETTVTEDFEASFRTAELHAALVRLTPYERRLVVLACLEEMPWRRIAEELHKPIPTVYGHYRKALEKVRKELTGRQLPQIRRQS